MEEGQIIIRTYFLDATAIVKLVYSERGSEKVRRIVKTPGSSLYTSWILIAEALGVLKRKWMQNELENDEYNEAVYRLLGYVERNLLQPLDLDIVDGTARLRTYRTILLEERRKYPDLDIADLLQFRVIRESFLNCSDVRSTTQLMTADKKLAKAAQAEGFEVLKINANT